jgi:hypothetical protein
LNAENVGDDSYNKAGFKICALTGGSSLFLILSISIWLVINPLPYCPANLADCEPSPAIYKGIGFSDFTWLESFTQ